MPRLEEMTSSIIRLQVAVERQDLPGLHEALGELRRAVAAAAEGERTVAAGGLEPVLREIPVLYGGDIATLAGIMVGVHGDPAPLLDVLVDRACGVMEDAAVFAGLHRDLLGDLPSRDEPYDAVADRFEDAVAASGVQVEAVRRRAASWWVGRDWVEPVVRLCQRADVRRVLPQRDRLQDAVAAVGEELPDVAPALSGLLRVLDRERIVVLHRESGSGFWVTIGGVGANFQLHTLLAARLLPHLRPQARKGLFRRAKGPSADGGPTPAMVAAADGTGDRTPDGGIVGQFELLDARGVRIPNEGAPDEIPVVDGHRVVVLDPPACPQTWSSGRTYPLMVPSVAVEPMTADVAGSWLGRVKPTTVTV